MRFFTLLFLTLSLFSCQSANEAHYTGSGNAYASTGDKYSEGRKEKESDKVSRRIVSYNATLNLVVKNLDSANVRLSALSEQYGGFMLSMDNSTTVIRVRSENLQKALAEIYSLGKVEYKNVRSVELSNQFKDLQIRLENAGEARKRYLELLSKATDVQSAISVEKELDRINLEIDQLQANLNQLNESVVYSTITVNLREKVKPGIVGYVFIGLFHAIKWLFVR